MPIVIQHSPSAFAGGVSGGINEWLKLIEKRKEEQAKLDAEAKARNSQAWGDAISGIGQSVSSALQKRSEKQTRQKERDEDWSHKKELREMDRTDDAVNREAQTKAAIELLAARQSANLGYDPRDQSDIDKIDNQIRTINDSNIINPDYAKQTIAELQAKKEGYRKIPKETAQSRFQKDSYYDPNLEGIVYAPEGGTPTVLRKPTPKTEKRVVDPDVAKMDKLYDDQFSKNFNATDDDGNKINNYFTAHIKTSQELNGYMPAMYKQQLQQVVQQSQQQQQQTTQPATTQPVTTTQPVQAIQASFQGQPTQQSAPDFDGMRNAVKQKALTAQQIMSKATEAGEEKYPEVMAQAAQTMQQAQNEAKQIDAKELSYYAETVTNKLPNEQRQMVVAKRDQLLQVIKQAEANQDLKTYQAAKKELQALMESLRQMGKGQR